MGYTQEQTHALQIATQKTWQRAVEKLAAAGGYNWQMFVSQPRAAKQRGPTAAALARF